MKRLSELERDVRLWQDISDDVKIIMELAEVDDDGSMAEEIEAEMADIEHRINSVVSDIDGHHIAILTVRAGSGGSEAYVWAEMLADMYFSWIAGRGFEVEVLDDVRAKPKGLRLIVMRISGRHSYALLKNETGVHRLSRVSEFGNGERHTSFASVEVIPEAKICEFKLDMSDVTLKACRPGGPGGQHSNKSDTAVRATHTPSGITVRCQMERSQYVNREMAVRLLTAKVSDAISQERASNEARNRKSKRPATFGTRRRSYVMNPYTLVKDHISGVVTSDVFGVLSGKLDDFVSDLREEGKGR